MDGGDFVRLVIENDGIGEQAAIEVGNGFVLKLTTGGHDAE